MIIIRSRVRFLNNSPISEHAAIVPLKINSQSNGRKYRDINNAIAKENEAVANLRIRTPSNY